MLPSMWRSELLHPLSVHFPIALLIVGSIFYVLSIFLKHAYFKSLRKFSFLLIAIGTATAWISIFTGSLAEDVVGPLLCDPEIRLNHEDFSYYVAYMFTAFILFHILSETLLLKYTKFFVALNLILVLGGTASLAYTSHLGATLTYQQAAGVYNPGLECKGF